MCTHACGCGPKVDFGCLPALLPLLFEIGNLIKHGSHPSGKADWPESFRDSQLPRTGIIVTGAACHAHLYVGGWVSVPTASSVLIELTS